MHDLLLNVIGIGFIGYGLWKAGEKFYNWAYYRGYNEGNTNANQVFPYQVDSLKERVAKLEGKK